MLPSSTAFALIQPVAYSHYLSTYILLAYFSNSRGDGQSEHDMSLVIGLIGERKGQDMERQPGCNLLHQTHLSKIVFIVFLDFSSPLQGDLKVAGHIILITAQTALCGDCTTAFLGHSPAAQPTELSELPMIKVSTVKLFIAYTADVFRLNTIARLCCCKTSFFYLINNIIS